jgi:diketogulonate reductase-like aldo/keto reductase
MNLSRRSVLIGAAAAVAASTACDAKAAGRLYRQVPKTGEKIPIVGLGTYIAFDIDHSDAEWRDAGQTVRNFLALGGRLIDSSPMYGRAEAAMGEWLDRSPLKERAFIATKIWSGDAETGLRQARRSEQLFGRRLDLLQVHNLWGFDEHLPRLRTLKERGRIRYIGATHYESGAYDDLERAIRTGVLDFVQVNYSVAEREAERRILPLARDSRVAVIVNRPFAGGALFGRVRAKPLPSWARAIGCESWAQLLLKYVLADTSVTCAIPGTRNPRHVVDNLGAALAPLPNAAFRRRIIHAALDA